MKESGTTVHPNDWEMVGEVEAGHEGPLLVLYEPESRASGRRKWDGLQEQCSQQNSVLALPGMSEFVNPKRKRIYSEIGEDIRLLEFTAGLTSQVMK